MKVKIEPRDECLGDAICCDECPEVFMIDDEDGLAKVINANPDESLREAIQNAADECPAEIIIIEED
jgi:ferredoxin